MLYHRGGTMQYVQYWQIQVMQYCNLQYNVVVGILVTAVRSASLTGIFNGYEEV